jgi:hypothetical protein
MSTTTSIKRLNTLIDLAINHVHPPIDYERTLDAIIALANAVRDHDGEMEDLVWDTESGFSCITIDEVIVGAYWHLVEWSGGQASKSYAAQCALGSVFSPGMSAGPEPESSAQDVYLALHELAVEYYK